MRLVGSILVRNLEELRSVTDVLAKHVRLGMMIGLSGELGAGKTEFVRQLLRSLGVSDVVTSPTFVLETQYSVNSNSISGMLYHWDLYRLASGAKCVDEIPEDLLDRRRDANALVCVEWPEQVPPVLDLLDIRLMVAFCEEGQPQDGLDAGEDENLSSPRKIEIYCAENSVSGAKQTSGFSNVESIINTFLQAVPKSLVF